MVEKEDVNYEKKTRPFPDIFVAGVTGAGKSRQIYRWLKLLRSRFLIISCSNNDYVGMFIHETTTYGLDPEKDDLVSINPLYFSRGIHVKDHINRLMALFTLCWSLDDEMRSLLEMAIIRSYEDYGWNIQTSENRLEAAYPYIGSILKFIEQSIDMDDHSDEKQKASTNALIRRLRHLLENGTYNMTFCDKVLSDQKLFERNVIVDLSRFPSSEVKTLIMGTLVMRLYEYRELMHSSDIEVFKHATVIEDAHVLLGRNAADKGKNEILKELTGAGVLGEHFAVVERSPDLLDESVIANAESKFFLIKV